MQKIIEYLFDSTTPPLSQSAFIAVCLVIVVSGVGAIVFARLRRNRDCDPSMRSLYKRLMVLGAGTAISGIVLVFFRQQHVFVLSARIVIYVWLAISATRTIQHVMRYRRIAPGIRAEREREMLKRKYLPH